MKLGIIGIYNLMNYKIRAKKFRISAPIGTVSSDCIDGVNKGGTFKIYSFKNKEGVVIQNYKRYISDNYEIKDIVTDIENKCTIKNILRRTIINGKEILREYQSFLPLTNPTTGELLFQKSFMNLTKKGDCGGFELCQKGTKPSGIKFNYNWNGSTTDIEYKNCLGHTLDLTETECQYLPFMPRQYITTLEQDGQITLNRCDFTSERVQEKINLAQKIQEKFHGIEGILPPAKGVRAKDLHIVKTSGRTLQQWLQKAGYIPGGECLGDGQINIATDISNNTDGIKILKLMAHECQHAADIIESYRAGNVAYYEAAQKLGTNLEEYESSVELSGIDATDFYDRILQIKGLARKGTEAYRSAVARWQENLGEISALNQTSRAEHDVQIPEQRANNKAEQEMNFVGTITQKLTNFLTQFIKTT